MEQIDRKPKRVRPDAPNRCQHRFPYHGCPDLRCVLPTGHKGSHRCDGRAADNGPDSPGAGSGDEADR